jgi:hypothetical protein
MPLKKATIFCWNDRKTPGTNFLSHFLTRSARAVLSFHPFTYFSLRFVSSYLCQCLKPPPPCFLSPPAPLPSSPPHPTSPPPAPAFSRWQNSRFFPQFSRRSLSCASCWSPRRGPPSPAPLQATSPTAARYTSC